MAFYFVGGEDHDFTRVGVTSVNTATTAARRTANARCTLQVGGSASATDGWQGALSSSQSSFWFTARYYCVGSASGATNHELLSFLDGTTRRLVIRVSTGGVLQLVKRTSTGTNTILATSAVVGVTNSVLQKIDAQITYGVSGAVNVYLDNTLIISYSGDVTTNSATTLNGFVLGPFASNSIGFTHWSEIICGSDDTRSLSLVTLAPSGAGNANSFTSGAYTDLDETTLSDSDIATSAAADQLLQVTVDSSGIIGNPAIRALAVSARAQRGGSGPQNAQLSVRTGGNDYFSGTLALPASFERIANVWETNPATAGAWAYTTLTAAGLNVGIKSIT